MLCYRCGTHNPDTHAQCSACGQVFQHVPKAKLATKAPAKGAPYQIGDVVANRYRIDAFIGQGPVGSVYRVTDTGGSAPDDTLALKVIQSRFLQTSEDRAAFGRALGKSRKMLHPGISRIYADGEDAAGRVYFTMQYTSGTPLSRILELRRGQRVFTLEECEPLLAQICAALEYAHRFTAHGALKPANIIVRPDDLKVTDFVMLRGLPRRPYQVALEEARRYTAPELRPEAADVLPAADIYSLGVIAAEMLTAERGEAMERAVKELPAPVRAWLYQAMDSVPGQRFRSPNEMLNGLLALLDEPSHRPEPLTQETSITEVSDMPAVVPTLPVEEPITDAETSLVAIAPPPAPPTSEPHSVPIALTPKPRREPVTKPVTKPIAKASSQQLSARLALQEDVPASALRPREKRFGFGFALAAVLLLVGAGGLALALQRPTHPKSDEAAKPEVTAIAPLPEPTKPEAPKKEEAGKKLEERTPASVTAPLPSAPRLRRSSPAAAKTSGLVEIISNEDLPVSSNVPPAAALVPHVGSVSPVSPPVPPSPAPVAAEPSCPAGMNLVSGGRFTVGTAATDDMRNFSDRPLASVEVKPFCVDRYEYPNVSGAVPTTNVSLRQAKQMCESAGKRLCVEDEWERACKGPMGSRFPYGHDFDEGACNVGNDGERPIKRSGSSAQCRSGYGVIDMSGNVAEWTDSRLAGTDFVIKGGDAAHPDYSSRCANRVGMSVARKAPNVGFRCCADPQ